MNLALNKMINGWFVFYERILVWFFSTFPGKLIHRIIKNTKLYGAIKANDRVSSLDVFRAIAIIGVVIYHFHHKLKFGNLGVDLFFVISGLLVGGLLTRDFERDQRINVPKFLLQRGFKIWPSYYFFLIFGSLIAFVLYRISHPDFLIPLSDIKKYIFFFQNYDEYPVHWVFDHIWSLCVEEHFYIMLPLVFVSIQLFSPKRNKRKALYGAVIFAILFGIVAKYVSFYYTKSGDTYTGTHNRIDALAWGVLLNLVITGFGKRLKEIKWMPLLSLLGIILFSVAIYINLNTADLVYKRIVLQSLTPVCFFMIILGAYYLDFSRFYILRSIGYYSYNWYLWHPMFVWVITDIMGPGRLGLAVYTVISLSMAILATMFVEEPFLELRKKVIPKIFKKNIKIQTSDRVIPYIKNNL
ncbi:MAG TPA: acyltransferase [Bacteroidales bacterium]|nr:acyltransferase [Bacteroidales bacterium]